MAATALYLQVGTATTPRLIRNPSFILHFSSSTTLPDPNSEDQNPTPSPPSSHPQSSFPSHYGDVKASLKQQQPPSEQHRQPGRQFNRPFPAHSPPSKVASLGEVYKNLGEFRRRSSPPLGNPVSLEELYKRNMLAKGGDSGNETNKAGNQSYEAIRQSLRRHEDLMSLSKFKDSLRISPGDQNVRNPTSVLRPVDKLPHLAISNELKEKRDQYSLARKTEFVKMYGYKELGEKLKKLRPEAQGGNWFSLGELNERLMKLREMEEKETEARTGNFFFRDLRDSLIRLKSSEDEKAKPQIIQRLDILSHFGKTPTVKLGPPKEHLVEKYFHPDNMSASEKLKVELQKVRDEFKMSESDCGSARVQVAQLTVRIKHLGAVLHKKDKHSRRGLQRLIQQRKKWLKYLRRTDWDSYTLLLSKLSLRDNPDYKN